jgi:hypothetical protein
MKKEGPTNLSEFPDRPEYLANFSKRIGTLFTEFDELPHQENPDIQELGDRIKDLVADCPKMSLMEFEERAAEISGQIKEWGDILKAKS